MSVASSAATPPGWYPDPEGRPEKRWWNGTTWTGSYAPVVAAAVPAPAPDEKSSANPVAETMQLTSASQLSSLPSGPGYASLLAALPAVPVWVEPTPEPTPAAGGAYASAPPPTFTPAGFAQPATFPAFSPAAPGSMAGPPALPGLAALPAYANPAYASNGTAMPSAALPASPAPLTVQNPQLALASSSSPAPSAPTGFVAPVPAQAQSQPAPVAFTPAPVAPTGFAAPASWAPPSAAPQAVHTQQQWQAQPAFTPPIPTPAPSYAQAVPLSAPAPAPTVSPRPAQQFPQSAPSFLPAEPAAFVPSATPPAGSTSYTPAATAAPALSYVAPSYSPPQSSAARDLSNDGPQYQPFAMVSAVRTGPVGPPDIAYTTAVWAQALLPLIVMGAGVSLALWLPDFYSRFVQVGLLAVLVIATIALAVSDYRTLREAGHTNAAHPAWVLFSPLVYLSVRAARTRDEAQKGVAPLLIWLLATGAAVALWFLIPNWASDLLITPAD